MPHLSDAIHFVRNRGYAAYCAVIDCMAVALAIDETILETMEAYVGIETQGTLTLGMTVIDRRHHHAWTCLPKILVACRADYRRFLRMLTELVL